MVDDSFSWGEEDDWVFSWANSLMMVVMAVPASFCWLIEKAWSLAKGKRR